MNFKATILMASLTLLSFNEKRIYYDETPITSSLEVALVDV
jgi:hypothetical protein